MAPYTKRKEIDVLANATIQQTSYLVAKNAETKLGLEKYVCLRILMKLLYSTKYSACG